MMYNTPKNSTLVEYIMDCENPEKNFNLAFEYWKLGQTAAASSFFIRAAERYQEQHMRERAYECLLHASQCFLTQKNRETTVRSLILTALNLCSTRPEAYYYICTLLKNQSRFNECYTLANLALKYCCFDKLEENIFMRSDVPLETISYSGIHGLIYLKAVSSWWLGKISECGDLYFNLKNNYWDDMSEEYRQKIHADVATFNLRC